MVERLLRRRSAAAAVAALGVLWSAERARAAIDPGQTPGLTEARESYRLAETIADSSGEEGTPRPLSRPDWDPEMALEMAALEPAIVLEMLLLQREAARAAPGLGVNALAGLLWFGAFLGLVAGAAVRAERAALLRRRALLARLPDGG